MAYVLTQNAVEKMENSEFTQNDTVILQIRGIEKFRPDACIIVLNDGSKQTQALAIGRAYRLIRKRKLTNLSIILVKKFHIVKNKQTTPGTSESNQKFDVVILLDDVTVLIEGSGVKEIINVDYSELDDNDDDDDEEEESDDDSNIFNDSDYAFDLESDEDWQYRSPERKKDRIENEINILESNDKANKREENVVKPSISEKANEKKRSKVKVCRNEKPDGKDSVKPIPKRVIEPIEKEEENIVKLNTLRMTNASETVIVKIYSINRICSKYFYLVIQDETCKMKCVAFSPFREQLLNKISPGTRLKISKAKIELVNMSYPVLCDNKFEMVLDKSSNAVVEFLPSTAEEIIAKSSGASNTGSTDNQQNFTKNFTSNCAGNSSQNSGLTIATLTATNRLPAIIVLVQHVGQLRTSSAGTKFLQTIITDDTDSMRCTLFNALAERFSTILQIGLRLRITGASVQNTLEQYTVPGRTRFDMKLKDESVIEVLGSIMDDASPQETPPDNSKDIEQPDKSTLKIADLKETSAAGPIQVKKVLNSRNRLILAPDGSKKHYYRCLVSDGSHEITCTVHEPHVQHFMNTDDRMLWKIEKAQVKSVDGTVDLLCDNRAELIVTSNANVTMISEGKSTPNSTQQQHLECESFRPATSLLLTPTISVKKVSMINSEALEPCNQPLDNRKYTPLDELILLERGDVVNCFGVLVKFEKSSMQAHRSSKLRAFCKLIIEDCQGTEIKVSLWGDDAIHFKADKGSIIELCDARLNIYTKAAELTIWPGLSTCNVNPTCKEAESFKASVMKFLDNELKIDPGSNTS